MAINHNQTKYHFRDKVDEVHARVVVRDGAELGQVRARPEALGVVAAREEGALELLARFRDARRVAVRQSLLQGIRVERQDRPMQ